MVKFNQASISTTPNTTTYEGGEAYIYADPRDELIHAVSTTFLDDKFYESAEERLVRVQELIRRIMIGNKIENFKFLINLLYKVRQEWNMRSISHVMAGEVLRYANFRKWLSSNSQFLYRYSQTWVRPDDMMETFAYWYAMNGGSLNPTQRDANTGNVGAEGLPKVLKKAMQMRFHTLSRFQAEKYQGRGKQFSLKNLIRIARPNLKDVDIDKEMKEVRARLFQQIAKETLEAKDSNWRAQLDYLLNVEKLSKNKAWETVMDKMGLFGVVNNLNAMDRAGVPTELAIKRLTDKEQVLRSRLLPFRFVTAIDVVTNDKYRQALLTALELSFANLVLPKGRYLIAIDTSASMKGRSLSFLNKRKNKTEYVTIEPIKTATMFGSIVNQYARKNPENEVDLVAFATHLAEIDTFDEGLYSVQNKIKGTYVGYGTNGHLVYEYAKMKKPYDYVFIFTDMQYTRMFQQPAPKGALTMYFDIGGYSNTLVPFNPVHNVLQLSGFSNKLFDYIDVIQKKSLVSALTNN